jgi:hypothetical protein
MSEKMFWVAEYSPSQDVFHVQTLEETISHNIQSMRKEQFSDYVVVGMYWTAEEAGSQCTRMRNALDAQRECIALASCRKSD